MSRVLHHSWGKSPTGFGLRGALLVLVLGASAEAQDFTCTEVLAFSQTLQWIETPDFLSHVDDARWQTRFRAGGDLTVWADPTSDAWRAPTYPECFGHGPAVLCSPCVQNTGTPDRVLVTATMPIYLSDVAEWLRQLRAVVLTVRQRHPTVRRIVLQPIVGGPNDRPCPWLGQVRGVRAAYNHPFIDQAIAQLVATDPGVVMGASPTVSACNQYRDGIGHLTEFARAPVGDAIGLFYEPRLCD